MWSEIDMNKIIKGALYAVIAFYIIATPLFFFTSKSNSFNNLVHRVYPFWPEVQGSEIETKEVVIERNDYPEVSKRRYLLRMYGPNISVKDSDIQEHFQLISDYTADSEKPFVTHEKKGETLEVKLDRKYRTIDLPLKPRPLAKYDLEIGSSDIPTLLDLDIVSGNADFNLQNLNLTSLDLNITSANINANIGKDALPSENIIIEMERGNVNINLPQDVGVALNFEVEKQDPEDTENFSISLNGEEFSELEGEAFTTNYDNSELQVPVKLKIEDASRITNVKINTR